MKKYAWLMLKFFMFVCVIPVVGMDRLKQGVDSTKQRSGICTDLMEAARALPSQGDEDHPCVKALKEALNIFRVEAVICSKGQPLTRDIKTLVDSGDRALQGANFLINNFILQRKRDEEKQKEDEKKLKEYETQLAESRKKLDELGEKETLYVKKNTDYDDLYKKYEALLDRATTLQDQVNDVTNTSGRSHFATRLLSVLAVLYLGYRLLLSQR